MTDSKLESHQELLAEQADAEMQKAIDTALEEIQGEAENAATAQQKMTPAEFAVAQLQDLQQRILAGDVTSVLVILVSEEVAMSQPNPATAGLMHIAFNPELAIERQNALMAEMLNAEVQEAVDQQECCGACNDEEAVCGSMREVPDEEATEGAMRTID